MLPSICVYIFVNFYSGMCVYFLDYRKNELNYFLPFTPFYIPWKHWKTRGYRKRQVA